MKIPELLAPAGNYEKLVTAVTYGADAIYLAGKEFGLRAKAGNFTLEKMAEGIAFAHKHGVKVYVTVNIFAHNKDVALLPDYLVQLAGLGVDGIIIADPGVLAVAQRVVPQLPIHLSTQANVTNGESAQFWLGQGVCRLNLARELSFAEICEIREQVAGELEVFVHGALCISYSGRCMLSSYFTGRNANKGACAHPCRFRYALVEEKRPGEYFPVEEDERGTYIFNSQDLCLLKKLPLLVAAGVDSLKIEGRMKSLFYVAGVVRIYRAALDYLKNLPKSAWKLPELIQIPDYLIDEIAKIGTRGMTENFFMEKPSSEDMIYQSSRLEQLFEPVAVVRKAARYGEPILVEIRNTVFPGEIIEYMDKSCRENVMEGVVARFCTEEGEEVEKANPGNRLWLFLDVGEAAAAQYVDGTLSGTDSGYELHGIFRRKRDNKKRAF